MHDYYAHAVYDPISNTNPFAKIPAFERAFLSVPDVSERPRDFLAALNQGQIHLVEEAFRRINEGATDSDPNAQGIWFVQPPVPVKPIEKGREAPIDEADVRYVMQLSVLDPEAFHAVFQSLVEQPVE